MVSCMHLSTIDFAMAEPMRIIYICFKEIQSVF
jgi:hypothetical protein